MGSGFIERNKRKSLLAALLLLLGGRGKYVAMLLVSGAVSVPFLLTGDRLERLLSFPAVRSALRATGLAADGPQLAPQPAGFEPQAANPKAAFWDRFLRAVNAPPPPAKTTTSTMAMLRGGAEAIGPAVLPEKAAGKPQPGKVKGVVNAKERAAGEEPDGVDLAGIAGPGAGPGGLDGDAMAQELGGRYGSAGPYANRTMLSGPGGAADLKSGIYNQVLNTSAEAVPPPASYQKGSRLGKVSGFSWRTANAKTSRAMGIKRARKSRALPQLGEAFTMGALAFDRGITPEYASAYNGAVFDGNAVDGDYLSAGDAITPTVPSTAFAESLLAAANQTMADAEACANSATANTNDMEDIASDLHRVLDTMDPENPPSKCCWWGGDARDAWNKKINGDPNASDPAFKKGIYNMCSEMNEKSLTIKDDCPGVRGAAEPDLIACATYLDMRINCNTGACFTEILLWIVGGLLFITVWAFGAVTGLYDLGTPQQMVQAITDWMLGEKPPDPGNALISIRGSLAALLAR